MKALVFAALLVTRIVWTACPAKAISVVVTIHPLALLLEEIAGERVAVHVLVPPGASPHEFEPRPSDLVRVARADAFLKAGGGLDDWAEKLFTSAGTPGKTFSLLEMLGDEDESGQVGGKQEDEDRGLADSKNKRKLARRHGSRHDPLNDPHVWLDPLLVRDKIVPHLTALLIRLDPSGAAHYNDRAARFRNSLGELDREIRNLLSTRTRHYVAFHNAWRHFAARYALEEIAVVQEIAGEEPTPRELGDLVRAARRAELRAILVEPQLDPRLARTLSGEFNGVTVLVDPLGDPEDKERSTYPGLLRFNARAFRHAMNLMQGETERGGPVR